MNDQTPSSLPLGYFVLGASIFVVIFTDGLLQSLTVAGIATIVGFFAYGGVARTGAAAQSLARYFRGH
jgi:hypothetical protein